VEIDLRLWRDLSPEDLAEYEALLDTVSPQEERDRGIAQRLTWAPVDPASTWVVRVRHERRLVSCVALIVRDVVASGRSMRAAGIRGLRTHPEHRRQGFGTAAMERATEFVWERLKPDLAILLSSVMAVPLYERLGWRSIEGPVFCEQTEGRVCYSEVIPEAPVMVLIPAGAEWPTGEIDLRGFPF
jgi:GNAT superfamily N-acetyltransferase